ncbi:MAG: FixJ family two-component response regulator [Rhodothermales bacterium]
MRGEVFADAVTAADLAAGVDPETAAISQREWERHVSDMAWGTISERFEPQVLAAFKALVSGHSGESVAEELGLSSSSVYVYKKRVLLIRRKLMLQFAGSQERIQKFLLSGKTPNALAATLQSCAEGAVIGEAAASFPTL